MHSELMGIVSEHFCSDGKPFSVERIRLFWNVLELNFRSSKLGTKEEQTEHCEIELIFELYLYDFT